LIDEASHVLMARYREQFDPQVMTSALDWFGAQVGTDNLDKMLLAFVEQFPGQSVMRGGQTPAQWLAGERRECRTAPRRLKNCFCFGPRIAMRRSSRLKSCSRTGRSRKKPSTASDGADAGVFRHAAADSAARREARQPARSVARSRRCARPLAQRPARDHSPALEAAARRQPGALSADGREILREEELAIWAQFNPPGTRQAAAAVAVVVSHSEVPTFGDPAHEYEKFSPDTAWMPGAVLIAKSTYVWLAQLSRQYGRHIGRLDEIPDEELPRSLIAASILSGSSAYGSAAARRRPSSSSAATATPSLRPIRSSTIALPTIWAASRLTSTCATAPTITAFAWPATWCPTTWASIRPG
jgi:hypothetical protein